MAQDLLVLKAFRAHLKVISQERLLNLLMLADARPIANADVKRILGLKSRVSAWRWLAKLVELNMLEKKGNLYRISPYSSDLIAAISQTFRSAFKGKMEGFGATESAQQVPQEVLGYAMEGTQIMYERGLITESEFENRLKVISKAES